MSDKRGASGGSSQFVEENIRLRNIIHPWVISTVAVGGEIQDFGLPGPETFRKVIGELFHGHPSEAKSGVLTLEKHVIFPEGSTGGVVYCGVHLDIVGFEPNGPAEHELLHKKYQRLVVSGAGR